MKIRLHPEFNSTDKTLTLILDKDGMVQCVVDQFPFEELSKKELELIGRLVTGFNITFKKMWH